MSSWREYDVPGYRAVECPECHGMGTVPTADQVGQMWCMTCQHGDGFILLPIPCVCTVPGYQWDVVCEYPHSGGAA
jgi:phage/plasmid primase-like uncharacterized protein